MNHHFNFVVLGTSQYTLDCAGELIKSGCSISGLVTLPEWERPNNSVDFEDFCAKSNAELITISDINSSESINYLKGLKPDYILSTWPKIIGDELLAIPKNFVIGTHPTPLPICRGRHPLHWLICLGISNTAITFFRMNSGIDDGAVLIQTPFLVGHTINEANLNMSTAARHCIHQLIEALNSTPLLRGYEQEPKDLNYLRKRDLHDVTLDPRMSSLIACKIIHSFAIPYPGAILFYSTNKYLIVLAATSPSPSPPPSNWRNCEHGYVFRVGLDSLDIRFDDAVITLKLKDSVPSEITVGTKLRPPSYYFSNS